MNNNELQKTDNQSVTPMAMIQQAIEKGSDLSVVEKLMDLQERWEKNEALKAFNLAISNFKSDSETMKIIKTEKVDYTTSKGRTSYKHANLAKMLDSLCKQLSKHGLNVRWKTESLEPIRHEYEAGKFQLIDRVRVTCILSHLLGYNDSCFLEANADISGGKNSIQGIGSSTSYLERYTLKAILGISESDDDNDGGSMVDKISKDQMKELINLIQKSKAAPDKFLLAFKIERLEDMPADKFKEAVNLLNIKIKKGDNK